MGEKLKSRVLNPGRFNYWCKEKAYKYVYIILISPRQLGTGTFILNNVIFNSHYFIPIWKL